MLLQMMPREKGLAYSTPFQLTICGLEELRQHGASRVTHMLSILDPGSPDPEMLREFPLHQRLKLYFHDIIEPATGWIAPERWDVEVLLAFGRELATAQDHPHAAPIHLLVHCHAGLSRSTAAAILILAQHDPDHPADDAVGTVTRLRPQAWPNLRIIELGDALLGRGGEIVAAARMHYRMALLREPWLASSLIQSGRAREVAAAGVR